MKRGLILGSIYTLFAQERSNKAPGLIREVVYPFYFCLLSEVLSNSQIAVVFRNGGPVIEYKGEKRN